MTDLIGKISMPPPVPPARLGEIKITVWRHFEKLGRGQPVVVLGDQSPGDGWILCRSATVNISHATEQILLDLAAAFASFGQRRINTVGFLTDVLEDFATACLALGIAMPIENFGGWVVYEIDELQPASEGEYHRLLREIDRVFGRECAQAQANAWLLNFEPQ